MGEFFKSALGFIGGGTSANDSNDFVGQTVELGQYKLRIKKFIAEGGFAFVFSAQDLASGKDYALKRLFAHDDEKAREIVSEIKIHKKVSGHPNIVDFIAAASESGKGKAEYLVLSEFCSCGPVIDLLNARSAPFECNTVVQVFWQLCNAVRHMHSLQPPLIHRDIKLENLLLNSAGVAKLCDFGSATTTRYAPDMTWSALQRSSAEDEITKNTTPMYRAPEMLDLYQNLPVDEAADIWAAGCVLFLLCFFEHPFADGAKLRIINGKYTIPESDTKYTVCHDLIRAMLQVDPTQRPPIVPLVEQLQEVASARGINLQAPLQLGQAIESPVASQPTPSAPQPQNLGAPTQTDSAASKGYQQASAAQSLFGALKGGAGSFVRNIAAASNKVLETVQATINKSDLDFSYITSRVAVMSYPAEGVEAAIKNHFNDVKTYLDLRHPGAYAVYNLTDRSYSSAKFDNRVSECGLPQRRVASLHSLYGIMHNMHLFLRQNQKNVCILHCTDGKAVSASVAIAFLCYCRLYDSPEPPLRLFTARRAPPNMLAAHVRYIDYVCRLNRGTPAMPHNRPVKLVAIGMSPVPYFNRLRNGVRPFVEVYVGSDRVLSTSQEYDKMRGFSVEEGTAKIPIGVPVTGDVTIIAYHARSTFGGKVQGKITSMKILQVQFHTGMVVPEAKHLRFTKSELDQLDTDSSKYPENFELQVELSVAAQERPGPAPLQQLLAEQRSPKILFTLRDEMKALDAQFGPTCLASPNHSQSSEDASPSPQAKKRSDCQKQEKQATQPAPSIAPKSTFFDTLDWQDAAEPAQTTPSEQEASIPPSVVKQADDEIDLLNISDSSPDEPLAAPTAPGHQLLVDDFDLLGLRSDPAPSAAPPVNSRSGFDPFASSSGSQQPSTAGAFDPFANFDQSSGQATVSQQAAPAASDFFDPLSSAGPAQQEPDLLQSWDAGSILNVPRNSSADNLNSAQQASMFRNSSSGNLPQQGTKANGMSADPFAGLDGLGGVKNKPPSSPAMGTSRGTAVGGMMGSRPVQQQQGWGSPSHGRSGATQPAPKPSMTQPQARPNYNTSAFNSRMNNPNQSKGFVGGPRPKVSGQEFSEFLPTSDFKNKSNGGPKTIDDLRKKDLEETLDPETIKVREWTAKKERNLRALLCSLHQILWEGEGKWKEIGMAQLVTANDVKKWYRRAVLSVHPDKLQDSPHLSLARAIFVELNDAWAEFEEKGCQNLY